jgi:trigger factor
MAAVKTSVTELPESRVRVRAEVPAEEVERRLQEAARHLGARMRVPGFRRGKVPPPVVISRLGREAVLDEALRSSLSRWYADAIERAGIAPVGKPELDVSELPAQGQPLSFTIEIGVRPRATLGRYKGLEVGRREPAVAAEEIDAEIERLREQFATLETVQRPAERGDHVVVDYIGYIDDQPFEGGAGRDQLLELGSGRLLPGFEEQLVGASAGEQRTIEVTFPADYQDERLAGRRARFEVTVGEVKAKRLPALDDEFALQAGGFDTLAELRQEIATRLAEAQEQAIAREFERAVVDAAVAEAEVEVPRKLVHARAHELLDDTLAALEREGISKEAYLKVAGKDEETLAREAEPEAERTLKREAVLAAVIEAEGIRPSDEEVQRALQPAAERAGTSAAQVMRRLRDSERIERVRHDVAARKAVELLVREAKPIPVEQAKARERLWTPGRESRSAPAGSRGRASGSARAGGRLWTPGSSSS